jgi:hypothetical protein
MPKKVKVWSTGNVNVLDIYDLAVTFIVKI